MENRGGGNEFSRFASRRDCDLGDGRGDVGEPRRDKRMEAQAMTTLAQRPSEYASSLQQRDLRAEVTKYAKRLIIDTIGCALGAYTSEPSKIARDLAAAFGSGRARA